MLYWTVRQNATAYIDPVGVGKVTITCNKISISNPPRRFFQPYKIAARRKNYAPPLWKMRLHRENVPPPSLKNRPASWSTFNVQCWYRIAHRSKTMRLYIVMLQVQVQLTMNNSWCQWMYLMSRKACNQGRILHADTCQLQDCDY